MVVNTQKSLAGPPRSLGLHVGSRNARQYFPRHADTVELHMDHLVIACPLPPEFWEGNSDIYDERLSCWLHSKRDSGKLGDHPSPITLIPLGNASFRVLLTHEERKDPLRLGPAAQVTRLEILGPVEVSRPPSFEEHSPAGRRLPPVATLKGHDHPALAAIY